MNKTFMNFCVDHQFKFKYDFYNKLTDTYRNKPQFLEGITLRLVDRFIDNDIALIELLLTITLIDVDSDDSKWSKLLESVKDCLFGSYSILFDEEQKMLKRVYVNYVESMQRINNFNKRYSK